MTLRGFATSALSCQQWHLSKKTKKKSQLSPLPHPTLSWLNPNCLAFFRMLFWMFFGDRRNMEPFRWAQWLHQLHEVCASAACLFRQRLVCLKPTSWEHLDVSYIQGNWTSCLWQHVSRRARFTFVEVQDNFMMQPQVATNAFPRCFNETYEFYHWSRSCHDDVDDSEWCIFVDLNNILYIPGGCLGCLPSTVAMEYTFPVAMEYTFPIFKRKYMWGSSS